ncbi:uncharacterized protein [Onthophagus taurus]|uniref:uncharacterized protein n=1 Tax=Onthophagus taurus TaxID=166361 RepID=UPI000C204B0A|nr:small proline-rich protein 2B-like [Onthophagus taurus]
MPICCPPPSKGGRDPCVPPCYNPCCPPPAKKRVCPECPIFTPGPVKYMCTLPPPAYSAKLVTPPTYCPPMCCPVPVCPPVETPVAVANLICPLVPQPMEKVIIQVAQPVMPLNPCPWTPRPEPPPKDGPPPCRHKPCECTPCM